MNVIDDIFISTQKKYLKAFSVCFQTLRLSRKSPHLEDVLLVSGWGLTSHQGVLPSNLQSVNVTVVKNDICNSFFTSIKVLVPSTGFCAGNSTFNYAKQFLLEAQ